MLNSECIIAIYLIQFQECVGICAYDHLLQCTWSCSHALVGELVVCGGKLLASGALHLLEAFDLY